MKTLFGNQLTPADRAHVLAAYVHRFTKQHRPNWARKPRLDGTAYPVQFASDADWLAHTRFHVTKAGRLDNRHTDCESSATWPDNPELRDLSDKGPYATPDDAETARECGWTVAELRLDRAKSDTPTGPDAVAMFRRA